MSQLSLLKFANETQDPNGISVRWGRAAEDGLPFRGPSALYKNDDEYEANVSRICDFKHKRFNLDDPEDSKHYGQVMDRIVNGGWYKLFWIDRDGLRASPPVIYVEWGEYYMEDSGKKIPVSAPPPAMAFPAGVPDAID